ncbi:MAG: hypothetical protein K0S93_212 [Nitrososphaeraceae archaeon]|jgi:hypothetical protein|nr:hypothetical protein [Nitrososphaeraceae archaeon]
MHKLLVTIKELISGGIAIDKVDKTHISKTPGDVTQVGHN